MNPDDWNAAHPEGSTVKYYHSAASKRGWEMTRTTGPAHIAKDGIARIKVASQKHAVPLEQVERIS